MRQIIRGLLYVILIFSGFRVSAQSDFIHHVAPNVGQKIEVTPGQQFYSDLYTRPLMAYHLDHPFKSKMPGAMGMKFSFSIDDSLLMPSGKSHNGEWSYYIPNENRFKASYSLLGSVIRDGDSVGLRVSRNGIKEWFVDNSIYNHMISIWTRKVNADDPAITMVPTGKEIPSNLPINRLIYLGCVDEKIRIRIETVDPTYGLQKDEFIYPIDKSGHAIFSVKGAEFTLDVIGLKAWVTVNKQMTSDVGSPVD